jgi:prophage regulatory protein
MLKQTQTTLPETGCVRDSARQRRVEMKSQKEQLEDTCRDFLRMKMLREREVRQITGLSRVTRWRLEQRGEFPRKVRLTQRCVGFLESEVLDWLTKRVQARESHPIPPTTPFKKGGAK